MVSVHPVSFSSAFLCAPEHHERSGTTHWLVEVDDAVALLAFEAGPDDTEEEVRRIVETWWNPQHN